MATSRRSTANKVVLAVLGAFIVALSLALVFSCSSTPSQGAGTAPRDVSVSGGPIDGEGRVTLAGVLGKDGPDLIALLEEAGYRYDAGNGYWQRTADGMACQLVVMGSDGGYITQETLAGTDGAVDAVYEIGLYSKTAQDEPYGVDDQGVDVTRREIRRASNQTATVAIADDGTMRHLVLVNAYTYDGYEYEVYSASEQMLSDSGASGIDARDVEHAYDEVLENYGG